MNTCIDLLQLNWLAIVLLTVFSFPLGTIWHSKKLFGTAWFKDAKPQFDKSKKSGFIFLFGFTAIAHFLLIAALDYLIGAESNWINGMGVGFSIALIFISLPIAVTHAFVGRTIRLTLIDAGFYLFLLTVAGAVLGNW